MPALQRPLAAITLLVGLLLASVPAAVATPSGDVTTFAAPCSSPRLRPFTKCLDPSALGGATLAGSSSQVSIGDRLSFSVEAPPDCPEVGHVGDPPCAFVTWVPLRGASDANWGIGVLEHLAVTDVAGCSANDHACAFTVEGATGPGAALPDGSALRVTAVVDIERFSCGSDFCTYGTVGGGWLDWPLRLGGSDVTLSGTVKLGCASDTTGSCSTTPLPVANVTIEAKGVTSDSATTGTDGSYQLSVPQASYQLTPSAPGYTFTPPSVEVAAGGPFTGNDFKACPQGSGDDQAQVSTPRQGRSTTIMLAGHTCANQIAVTYTASRHLMKVTWYAAAVVCDAYLNARLHKMIFSNAPLPTAAVSVIGNEIVGKVNVHGDLLMVLTIAHSGTSGSAQLSTSDVLIDNPQGGLCHPLGERVPLQAS